MLSKEEVEEFMSQADVVSSAQISFVVRLRLGLGLGVIVFIDQTELSAPCLVFWLFCNFPLITPRHCHRAHHPAQSTPPFLSTLK